jgi:hypothetical protein
MVTAKKAHEATRTSRVESQIRSPQTVKEREERTNELINRGWTIEVLNNAQPKLDYYRHAKRMTAGGKVLKNHKGEPDGEVGKLIPNQPGDPDTAMKLSTRGLLPWPPSETCKCRACREEYGTERTDEVVMTPAAAAAMAKPSAGLIFDEPEYDVEEVPQMPPPNGQLSCPDPECGFVTKPKKGNHKASLLMHVRHRHE